MNTSRRTIFGIGATVILLASACSGNDSPATVDSTDPSTSVTPSEPESDGDPIEPTDAIDDSILSETRTGSISIDGVETTFDGSEIDFGFEFGTEFDEPTPVVIGYFGTEATEGLVIVPFDANDESPTGQLLYVADGTTLRTNDATFDQDSDDVISASGTFENGARFETSIGLGTGTSTFELDGNRAIVRGDLGSTAYEQVQHLIEAHPEVDTLVLQDVPGSVNDEINVQTGRLVRAAGYSTIVPSNGMAASGGVDLFAAGVVRIAEPGAQLGIHSWCCTPDGTSPADLPVDDPQHDEQLAYYTLMLGEEDGPEFYFLTLNAAPADAIYFMTEAELTVAAIVTSR